MLLLCEEKFEGRIALFDIDLAKKGSLDEIPLANSSAAFFSFSFLRQSFQVPLNAEQSKANVHSLIGCL